MAYDVSVLTALDAHFKRLIERKSIPGALYSVAQNGQLVGFGAVGEDFFGNAARHDNIWRIASITKVFTAAAIMQLVEKGLIRTNTLVKTIMPEFDKEPFDNINITHLLTHTSGLWPDDSIFMYREGFAERQAEHSKHVDEAFEKNGDETYWENCLQDGLYMPTGKEWAYCSFGFSVLGEIISRVSGVFANDYIEENICKPLKLNDTTFTLTKGMVPRLFIAADWIKERAERVMSGVAEEKPTIPKTAGGLFSTAADLCRFASVFYGGGSVDGVRILGRKTLEYMTKCHVWADDFCWGANGSTHKYALGFDLKQGNPFTYPDGTLTHEGAGPSAMFIDVPEKFAAVWLAPHTGEWIPETTHNAQNIIWSGII